MSLRHEIHSVSPANCPSVGLIVGAVTSSFSSFSPHLTISRIESAIAVPTCLASMLLVSHKYLPI
ncbi:hypothetical protein N657DRAFT_19187 [Parathielavia appendiculata]|uniref:Uncharacterized protein n=1 Tax=Parathielavia appendiculata TaxID=2587402 RepID=A0AAN6U8F8_9PEZI|nr:hypothetical protein N657DRAFT_19187 [Parathielavia appendiculata]